MIKLSHIRDPQFDNLDFETCMAMGGYPMPNHSYNWCDYPFNDEYRAWMQYKGCINQYTEFELPLDMDIPDCSKTSNNTPIVIGILLLLLIK